MCIFASFNFLPFQVNFNCVIFTIYYGNELCLSKLWAPQTKGTCITQFDTKIICKEPCEYFWPAFKFWISHLKTAFLTTVTYFSHASCIQQSSHLHLFQNWRSRLLTKTNITVYQWNSKLILFFINYKQIYSKPAETLFHLSASLNIESRSFNCSMLLFYNHWPPHL